MGLIEDKECVARVDPQIMTSFVMPWSQSFLDLNPYKRNACLLSNLLLFFGIAIFGRRNGS